MISDSSNYSTAMLEDKLSRDYHMKLSKLESEIRNQSLQNQKELEMKLTKLKNEVQKNTPLN